MHNIIYNPADIDSVIAAAYLATLLAGEEITAAPASSKLTPKAGEHYHWVGTGLVKNTMQQYMDVCHHGYLPSQDRLDAGTRNNYQSLNFGDANDSNEYIFETMPSCSLKAVFAINQSVPVGPAWFITSLIHSYVNGDFMLEEEQATVYKNYIAAIQALSTNTAFQFQMATEADVIEYRGFMKTVKRQLSTLYEFTNIKISGHFEKVPLINVNQALSPWMLRLLSMVHDYAVTYEQRRNRSIFTTFSRFAGFDEVLMRNVSHNQERGCLSYQL